MRCSQIAVELSRSSFASTSSTACLIAALLALLSFALGLAAALLLGLRGGRGLAVARLSRLAQLVAQRIALDERTMGEGARKGNGDAFAPREEWHQEKAKLELLFIGVS